MVSHEVAVQITSVSSPELTTILSPDPVPHVVPEVNFGKHTSQLSKINFLTTEEENINPDDNSYIHDSINVQLDELINIEKLDIQLDDGFIISNCPILTDISDNNSVHDSDSINISDDLPKKTSNLNNSCNESDIKIGVNSQSNTVNPETIIIPASFWEKYWTEKIRLLKGWTNDFNEI